MKLSFVISSILLAASLVVLPARAGENAPKSDKQTCCQKAKAEKKECTHKCCVAAQRAGKVCEKCNPSKDAKKDK